MFPRGMYRDEQDISWFLDVVDAKPKQPVDTVAKSLLDMGFSPYFVSEYTKLRWELVDGLTQSVADRVN